MASNGNGRNKETNAVKCSFCGKGSNEVRVVVKGPNVYICDECVELCNDIIEDELEAEKFNQSSSDFLTPLQIKQKLDEHIIGQEDAKKVLSVAVYNHYKRINCTVKHEELKDVEIQKSNILILGPTGSGKTYLAQTIAKILDVPFAIGDATSITEAGYVGEDVETLLLKLIQNADYDIERAERGIIYIDEIDKISKKGENVSITRDVSGEGVQQALLKIIEGTVASVPPQGGRKHPSQECIRIDTSNILFICGGAFAGIENIIQGRTNGHQSIGFGATITEKNKDDKEKALKDVLPGDLVKYGLIPEFIGRLPIITALDKLDIDALTRIITEPKNALSKQYMKLFIMDDVELEFTPDAIITIAQKALDRNTGARGLRAIMEDTMLDIMFELPNMEKVKKCIVTKEAVEKTGKVLLEYKEKSA